MAEYFLGKRNTAMDSNLNVPQGSIGATTSVQTANQLAEATSRLNAGVSGIDVSTIDPNLVEQIPKQHFKEINRLTKLSDAKATMHAPIVDLAGFSQQGWNELQRKETERQVESFIDKAHLLDPEGNTPINFHISTQIPGEQWRKIDESELEGLPKEERERIKSKGYGREGFQGYGMERPELMMAVNKESGQLAPLKYEVKEAPGGRKQVWDPERRLENLNFGEWDKEKLDMINIINQKAQIEERKARIETEIKILEKNESRLTSQEKQNLENGKSQIQGYDNNINTINTHLQSQLNNMYDKLKYIKEENKNKQVKELKELIDKSDEEFREKLENGSKIKDIKSEEDIRKILSENKLASEEYIEKVRAAMERMPTPELWSSSNEIAKEGTMKTVANAAFSSFEKYGERSPTLVLENYQPDLVLGRAQQLAEVVDETRKNFAEKLVKKKGLNEKNAKKIAEKLIGVTWDVGHINFMRKSGYSEKEIVEETKRIAPYVKQVHIADNFGFNDAHLPPGMGNAPIKEELEVLKKAGFKFDKGNVIVEAGAYVGQMKENPQGYINEYFNSPLYSYKEGEVAAAPYWPNIWEQETAYGIGYGDTLPEMHFRELYGSGFSSLPKELGGQTGGDRSRFAGTPNQ